MVWVPRSSSMWTWIPRAASCAPALMACEGARWIERTYVPIARHAPTAPHASGTRRLARGVLVGPGSACGAVDRLPQDADARERPGRPGLGLWWSETRPSGLTRAFIRQARTR